MNTQISFILLDHFTGSNMDDLIRAGQTAKYNAWKTFRNRDRDIINVSIGDSINDSMIDFFI